MTIVPQNNEPEKFLSPSDIAAILAVIVPVLNVLVMLL